MMMILTSAIIFLGNFDVVLDVILDQGHLNLIVHHIGREVPICRCLLQTL